MKRPPEIEAAYRRAPAGNECPPDAATSEGPCIAVGANAEASYPLAGAGGKHSSGLRKSPVGTRGAQSGGKVPRTTFRASTGQIWAFTGKRARVLEMLATQGQGVTQWDCLPWHTRLGASVHALREAGLSIRTEREGEYRHARYFLTTPGSLIIQGENSGEPVQQHRQAP